MPLVKAYPDSLDVMRIAQVVQVTFTLLVPAIACAVLFHEKPMEYLKINKPINLKVLIYSVVLIITIQPFISFTGYYNRMIELPESLATLNELMKTLEDTASAFFDKLLADRSFHMIMINLFVIAVVAGITEEFFFRGSMQQIFKKIVHNRHVAVWITAFIFSFIHFQFYGFIPRMLLGALLGYIFLWSGNLWIAVIVHTLNNAIAVGMYYLFHGTPSFQKIENMGTGDTLWLTFVSLIISSILLYLLSREYQRNNPEDFEI